MPNYSNRTRQAGELVRIRRTDGRPTIYAVLQDEPRFLLPRLPNPADDEYHLAQYADNGDLICYPGGGRLTTAQNPCVGLCERAECREWCDVWVPEGNTRAQAQRSRLAGHWAGVIYHISECEMEDAGSESRETFHAPQGRLHQEECSCPSYEDTLNGGEFYCPARGAPSAFCFECGGCRYCRLQADGLLG